MLLATRERIVLRVVVVIVIAVGRNQALVDTTMAVAAMLAAVDTVHLLAHLLGDDVAHRLGGDVAHRLAHRLQALRQVVLQAQRVIGIAVVARAAVVTQFIAQIHNAGFLGEHQNACLTAQRRVASATRLAPLFMQQRLPVTPSGGEELRVGSATCSVLLLAER